MLSRLYSDDHIYSTCLVGSWFVSYQQTSPCCRTDVHLRKLLPFQPYTVALNAQKDGGVVYCQMEV